MKQYLLILLLIISACRADDNGGITEVKKDADKTEITFDPGYTFVKSNSSVQDRIFYFFTLLEEVEGVALAIEADAEFSQLLADKKEKVSITLTNSNATLETYANALKFSDAEITSVFERLEALVPESKDLQQVVDKHMIPSGFFQQFSEIDDKCRYVQLTFMEAAEAVNNIIDVYGRGLDPRYPDIDKVSHNVNSSEYLDLLAQAFREIDEDQHTLFFQPALQFALKLLEINDRDEAGRYFPMEEGINKLAFDFLQTIDWEGFDYSLILVLGDSPNSPGDLPNISVGGMNRADHGAALFLSGKAPLIVFSGGHLYPVHTVYSEAIEMKKYVMDKYNIQEKFILVDPHARHTTTNMRNTGRLMFRYGIPIDKKAIVSTSVSHSGYVASNDILTRSVNQIGHIPFELFGRLSEFDLEFKPKIEVLHLDASDPLDP